MKKGQWASSSSDSDEKQALQSDEEDLRNSPGHGSSSENSSSGSDVVEQCRMKRSEAFNISFSFEEDQQFESKSVIQTQPSPNRSSSGDAVPELVQLEVDAGCSHLQKEETICEKIQPLRSGLFRPQELWLAVTRCLSVRWPPCLSFNRLDRSNRKLVYQMDCDQSEDSLSSVSLDLANESSTTSTSSEDINVTEVKKEQEEAKPKGVVKRVPVTRWGVSRSSPGRPRDRQILDLALASMILDKEMFLTVELTDRGEEVHDLRYQAEWKLSEKTKELAAGVWLSRTLID